MMHYTSNEERDRKSEELIECISLCASLTFLTIFYFSAQNKLELAFLTGHRSRSAFNEETYRWVKSKENGQCTILKSVSVFAGNRIQSLKGYTLHSSLGYFTFIRLILNDKACFTGDF